MVTVDTTAIGTNFRELLVCLLPVVFVFWQTSRAQASLSSFYFLCDICVRVHWLVNDDVITPSHVHCYCFKPPGPHVHDILCARTSATGRTNHLALALGTTSIIMLSLSSPRLVAAFSRFSRFRGLLPSHLVAFSSSTSKASAPLVVSVELISDTM
jgi:hypothetical protein